MVRAASVAGVLAAGMALAAAEAVAAVTGGPSLVVAVGGLVVDLAPGWLVRRTIGLLGTFWGLLGTINSVGAVIVNLDMSQEDFGKVFAGLQSGLLEPLEGMGTAFSSSLLGLGGSLVLGFLDIQAGHAQNRFYDGLEEWLTGVTNLVDRVDDDPR
jgi:hypothetical protein